MVASTGFDNKLKVWDLNGNLMYTGELKSAVCTMCTFQDTLGGDMVLLLGYCDGEF